MAIVDTITVAAAGTAVQSPKSGTVKAILFKARSSNAGRVYLGGSNVTSTRGVELQPGEAVHMIFRGYEQMQSWYANADTNNDAVDFVADNS